MSKKIALNLTIKDLKKILSTVKKRKRKRKNKRLYKNIYQNNIKTDSSHMMGNTIFNRNNQNLANENLRAQYKLIEDSINKDNTNKDKIKDDFEKLSLSVRNQNNRFTTDMYNMRNDLVDVQNQYNSFNTDFNTIKNQGFNAIQYVQNELNDLKNKYINDQNGSFGNSGGSDEFQGREDRLLISQETNINNNDNNNPTGLIEPIDTNINTIEEENNRILSDQSNNMNSNQEAYETKEDDKQTKLKVPRKPRDKTQEQIEKMNDKQKQDYELSKLKYEYYTEYKKIHRNDIGKINKKILDSTDLNYINKALNKFKKKNEIKLI